MPDVERPLESPADLEGYFDQGSKPREEWGVGIEYERLGVLADSGRAIPYHGSRSLSAILTRLVSHDRWRPVYAGSHIIALDGKGCRLTMEPGGQLELSGGVHRRLVELSNEVARYVGLLHEHSEPLGITWLGMGLHPFSTLDDIPWVPKPRYAIMSAHLARTGQQAHRMMKQTAGVQINLDYSDERDALQKLRASMGLTSLVTALFASSPILEGRTTDRMSTRSWIWQHTDPARCGLLPFVFKEDASFSDYLEYALDVPTMFILRNGAYLDLGGLPFRRFIAEGFQGHRATLGDFQLHLTTLFPEVRLKQHLEIRGGDSGDPALAVAQVALWKGILYDAASLREAWGLVSDLDWEARQAFHLEAGRLGTGAPLQGRTALEAGADLLQIAREGLRAQGEPIELLEPLAELVLKRRSCPAALLEKRWLGEWKQQPQRLVQECSRITLKAVEIPGDDLAEDY
jgi:glutamate--cysteine ligase